MHTVRPQVYTIVTTIDTIVMEKTEFNHEANAFFQFTFYMFDMPFIHSSLINLEIT